MEKFEQLLDYDFTDRSLLEEALKHPSLSYESKKKGTDNQRLEFLGDAVLQLILTEKLYKLFPSFPEGQLTKLRARLVSRVALEQYAVSINLGDYLLMSKGEEVSGGRTRASTLADAFESILGAIYLDGGMGEAEVFITKICQKWITQVEESPDDRNPKGQLQELLQSIAKKAPVYEVLEETGPDHDKLFKVKVTWQGQLMGNGEGNSKKFAEAQAALDALKHKRWEKVAS